MKYNIQNKDMVFVTFSRHHDVGITYAPLH